MAGLDNLKALMQPAESMVGAGIAGYLAGKNNGMPKLGANEAGEGGVPYDLLGGVALLAAGFFKVGGSTLQPHLTAVGTGMLSYFAGGYGAQMGVDSYNKANETPGTIRVRGWEAAPQMYAPTPDFAQYQQANPFAAVNR